MSRGIKNISYYDTGGFRFAKERDDYPNIEESIPSGAVTQFACTADEKTNTTGSKSATEDAENMVAKMRTIEDMCIMPVRVVTIATSNEVTETKSGESYDIAGALKESAERTSTTVRN